MSSAPSDKTDRSDPSDQSDEVQASDEALPVPEDEGTPDGLGRRAGLAVVQFYQSWISPTLPPSCRFRPTCSEYTRIAIQRYGLVRGTWMGLKRLSKCHPLHPGGHDPVP